MSQSLFTSITGMTTSQQKIDVVANNIANMNTTAFKSSNLTFENLYSKMLSYGSSGTSTSGGTNPMQIGLGTGISGISKDFTNGSIQSTGNSNDLNIQGEGWFTVQDNAGSLALTRDGSFSLDGNGYLVTQSGSKVLGTNSAHSTTGSSEYVYVPDSLNLVKSGKDLTTAGAGALNSLNNANITTGTFSFNVYNESGSDLGLVNVDASSATSLQDIANAINTAIKGNSKLYDGTNASVVATVNTDGTFSFNTKSVSGLDTVGKIDFSTPGDTSNFLYETDIATATMDTSGKYVSKVLSYQIDISPGTNGENTATNVSYAVTATGAIEATYSNGDTVTVEETNGNVVLKYITSDGKTISSKDINVSGGALTPANLQVQLAKVLNEQGLIDNGNNTYKTGANTGAITFSIGNSNGFGTVGSGGLESSNVSLAIEFANMIVAQRSVDANSRVFSVSSEVMERLVNMQ